MKYHGESAKILQSICLFFHWPTNKKKNPLNFLQNFNLPSLKNTINMPNLGDTKDKGEDVTLNHL